MCFRWRVQGARGLWLSLAGPNVPTRHRCNPGLHGMVNNSHVYLMICQHSFRASWWRHQRETFSALLVLCAGNSPVTGEFPSQRPVTRSLGVFFDLAWINGYVNNREAGDLRRHRAHYDVTVILFCCGSNQFLWTPISTLGLFHWHWDIGVNGPALVTNPWRIWVNSNGTRNTTEREVGIWGHGAVNMD